MEGLSEFQAVHVGQDRGVAELELDLLERADFCSVES